MQNPHSNKQLCYTPKQAPVATRVEGKSNEYSLISLRHNWAEIAAFETMSCLDLKVDQILVYNEVIRQITLKFIIFASWGHITSDSF